MTEASEVSVVPAAQLPIIAHQGEIELLDARWDLTSGRTVKFRLVETPDKPLGLHPFKQFVARRAGRVGTRFKAVFTHISDQKIIDLEAMLAGGGEPLGQGQWVRFWLDDDASHHPFAGYRGRTRDEPGDMFVVVFVELDDDESPINQEKRKRVEHAHRKQTLSQYAWMLCNNEFFLRYLEERVSVKGEQKKWSPELAARYIRWKCGIESRSELDRNLRASHLFHEQVREPYSKWIGVTGDG